MQLAHKILGKIAPRAMEQSLEWEKKQRPAGGLHLEFCLALHMLAVSQQHHSCFEQELLLVTTDGSYER